MSADRIRSRDFGDNAGMIGDKMKVHSDSLTLSDLDACARACRKTHHVDIQIGEEVLTGSRKRDHGITFKGYALTGRHSTNNGVYGADNARAATYAAWGYLIAEMFKRDPRAIVGQYSGVADFVGQCQELHARRTDPIQGARYSDPAFSVDFLSIVDENAAQIA